MMVVCRRGYVNPKEQVMKMSGRPLVEAVSRAEPMGIVIRGGGEPKEPPVIRAFVWGWKVRALPTLPFGRWKPAV
jgi:hypothetical protein